MNRARASVVRWQSVRIIRRICLRARGATSKGQRLWHTDRLRLDDAGSLFESIQCTAYGRRDDLQPDGAWIARCRSQDFQAAVGTNDDPECQMIGDAARKREASEGSSAFEPAAEAQQTNDTEMPQCELR